MWLGISPITDGYTHQPRQLLRCAEKAGHVLCHEFLPERGKPCDIATTHLYDKRAARPEDSPTFKIRY